MTTTTRTTTRTDALLREYARDIERKLRAWGCMRWFELSNHTHAPAGLEDTNATLRQALKLLKAEGRAYCEGKTWYAAR